MTLSEIISPVQCFFRAVFFWNRVVSELFRAVFLWFSALQRWSKFVTFWSEIVKKTPIKHNFCFIFSPLFTQNPIFQPFYYSTGHVRPRSMRKRRVRQFEFLTRISPEWFFHSWYTPKEHVFRDPNTFSNLHEAFSTVSHFVLIQRWTALIQRKQALNSFETALISAGFLNPFWNKADQR